MAKAVKESEVVPTPQQLAGRIHDLEAAVAILIRGAALGEKIDRVQQRTLLNLLNRIEGV